MSAPFVRHLLSTALPPDGRRQKSTRSGPKNKHLPKNKALIGNLDLAVLKKENQIPTHVTPRIAALAEGLVREDLVVVGPRPPVRNKDLLQIEKKKAYDQLCRLIAKAKKEIKNIDYQKTDRVSVHSEFYRAVEVDKEIYRVLFLIYILCLIFIFRNRSETSFLFLMIPRLVGRILGSKDLKCAFLLMQGLTIFSGKLVHFILFRIRHICQYFNPRFGKIQYIYMEVQRAHVQWLNHGSYTVMSELALNEELFLSDECGEIDISKIVGKVTVHERPSTETVIKPHEYFCKWVVGFLNGTCYWPANNLRFMYDPVLSTFTSIDVKRLALAAAQEPPNNCAACLLNEQRDYEKQTRELKDEHGNKHGVAFAGVDYHLEDFVLYRAETGPANIGYVIKIQVSNESVIVRKVGRIATLEGGILPRDIMRDEVGFFLPPILSIFCFLTFLYSVIFT